MPIPTYEEMIVPILETLSDGKVHPVEDLKDAVVRRFGVTQTERDQRLPGSPGVRTLDNRVGWAVFHLKVAGLLKTPSRAQYVLTEPGASLAKSLPAYVDRSYLVSNYPAAQAYFSRLRLAKGSPSTPVPPTATPSAPIQPTATPPSPAPAPSAPASSTTVATDTHTPEERLESAYQELRQRLTQDLYERLEKSDPTVFEEIISHLLVKMGYARSEEDILQSHGFSGDAGIDGIVQRDPLGLEQVYIQAKRWAAPVPLEPVVRFFEKVTETHLRAGVFVARNGFNDQATKYIEDPKHSANIAWLDGTELAELLVEFEVGIEETHRHRAFRVDENAFQRDYWLGG